MPAEFGLTSEEPVLLVQVSQSEASERLLMDSANTGYEGKGFRFKAAHLLRLSNNRGQSISLLREPPVVKAAAFKDALHDESTMLFVVDIFRINIPKQPLRQTLDELAHFVAQLYQKSAHAGGGKYIF